jgi:ATP-binding cassette subfamily B protein
MKRRNSENNTIRWLISGAKGKKRFIAILVLLNSLQAALTVVSVLLLSGLVDSAVAGDWEKFRLYCILEIVKVTVQLIFAIVLHFLEEYTKASLENGLKRRLFSMILTGDYAKVTAIHSGEWLTRMTSDTVVCANGMTSILPGIVGMVVRLCLSLSLMVAIAPLFGSALIVGGGVIVLFTWGFRRGMKRLHKQVQVADSELRVFLTERLGSMMILRAFEQEETAVKQGAQFMNAHKAARMKKNNITNLFQSGFNFMVSCAYLAGSIFCGYGILRGTMTYGSFTAILQLVSRVQGPIANISGYFPQYSAMLASAERLMEAEAHEQEEKQAVVEDMEEFYHNSFKAIGLRDAGFTYLAVGDPESGKENRPTVLKGLDMEIAKGEYVAFCGPSGCGKSTVLKLLMSMYSLDEGSRYLIDREGERDLDAGWRGLFAYVPQGNQLMSGTIRDVVTFADEEKRLQDEKIHRALEIACADQFISELPEGLDTLLGERGAGLSEGQMQRIAIARAIFSQRPILLLDEATSALDEATEARVLDNLRSMTDKTVIIVTHRPKALEITDKIITFKPKEE